MNQITNILFTFIEGTIAGHPTELIIVVADRMMKFKNINNMLVLQRNILHKKDNSINLL